MSAKPTTWKFRELQCGPRFHTIRGGFIRASAAHAFAVDWLKDRGMNVVADDADLDHTGCRDIMAAKNGALYQYSIDAERLK